MLAVACRMSFAHMANYALKATARVEVQTSSGVSTGVALARR